MQAVSQKRAVNSSFNERTGYRSNPFYSIINNSILFVKNNTVETYIAENLNFKEAHFACCSIHVHTQNLAEPKPLGLAAMYAPGEIVKAICYIMM